MFSDFTEMVEPLRLPIGGKTYEIPPVAYEDGLRLIAANKDGEPVSDEELEPIVLGDAGIDMRADRVPFAAMQRALFTAYTDFMWGREAAEAIWATGGNPKALEGYQAQKNASTPSDEASTTPRPASTSGTRKARKRP